MKNGSCYLLQIQNLRLIVQTAQNQFATFAVCSLELLLLHFVSALLF